MVFIYTHYWLQQKQILSIATIFHAAILTTIIIETGIGHIKRCFVSDYSNKMTCFIHFGQLALLILCENEFLIIYMVYQLSVFFQR